MIASHVPGRLRIRHASLDDAARAGRIICDIEAIDGCVTATQARRTGSILVGYDPQAVSPGRVEERVREILGPAPGRKAAARRVGDPKRTLAKHGMLAGLSVSMLSVLLGRKPAHVLAGAAFLGFAALHVGLNRRTVWK